MLKREQKSEGSQGSWTKVASNFVECDLPFVTTSRVEENHWAVFVCSKFRNVSVMSHVMSHFHLRHLEDSPESIRIFYVA